MSLLERLTAVLAELEPSLIEANGRRQAAVALLLRERDSRGLEILVIRRAENEHDPWSGHMALPGGGYEPGDHSVYDTARRETLEEIGIDLDEGLFLGRLDDVGPRRMPGQLRHVHLSDSDLTSGDQHRLPGRGKLPLKEFLAALETDGYPGAVSLELKPWPLGTPDPEVILKRMREALSFTREGVGG